MSKFVYLCATFALPSTFTLPPNPPIDRPILTARLELSGGPYCNILALADSGADACLFSLRMARALGLNLATLPRSVTTGLGNAEHTAYYATVTVDIGSGLRFETLAGFTKGMDSAGFDLPGQHGFFDSYNVEFRHRDRIFTTEPS